MQKPKKNATGEIETSKAWQIVSPLVTSFGTAIYYTAATVSTNEIKNLWENLMRTEGSEIYAVFD